MPTIQWVPSMATGEATVDDQHRQLVRWLNELLAAMSQGRGRHEVQRLLDDLDRYAATHFAHEEECMRRYGCPVASQNVKQHREFVATFTAFKREAEMQGPTAHLVVRLERELMDWLAGHIKGTDVQLAPCLKARAS